MEIRILGPIQVAGRADAAHVRGWRQRVVLAMLALRANRVVVQDQLIDAVWGPNPPGTPRSQIQICISGLRKMFAAVGTSGRIITRDPGYLLEIDEDTVDALVFERLVESARLHELEERAAEAVAELRAALALWRGPALADVPGDVVRMAATRLDERRIAVERDRIRLELALGRHNEIIADLRSLVEECPLCEDMHGNLMLALYRSGRQSDALDVYRRARSLLVERVGVEPSEHLRELAQAILRRDRGLDAPAALPGQPGEAAVAQPVLGGQLPAGIADFTGRAAEMADIAAALAEVDTGRGEFLPTVAISGRGGVGKSCLAIQAAHLLRDRFPDGNLYASLRPSGEDDVLSRFLRALGVPAGDIPAQRQDKVELYRALLIGRRVLVVLEDADCEEQVLPLVPGLPGCAAIVTSRWRLGALPGTRWIHLSELDIADSLAFMAKQLGDERVTLERPAAAELAARCAGLPLALRIATARLVARPHLRIAEFVDRLGDEATQLDELSHRGLDVRASIAASYERLSAEGKRLLRRLSVIRAADFPAAVGAMLLGTDADHGRLVMDMLADADLLTATRSTCDDSVRYRFAGLVRSYAREQLAASETPEEYERLVEQWDHDVPDVVLGEVGPESEHHGDRDSTAQLSLWL